MDKWYLISWILVIGGLISIECFNKISPDLSGFVLGVGIISYVWGSLWIFDMNRS